MQAQDRLSVWGMRAYSLLSGAILAQAFAPYNAAPLVFIVIPFFIVCLKYTTTSKEAFVRGWFVGFGLGLVGLHWISSAFLMQTEVPAWLAPFAVIAIASLIGFYKGLAFFIAKKIERKGLFRVFGFAFAWLISEWIQGHFLTGFPWLLLGSIWADWTVMLQMAAVVGLYGMSLLTVLTAGSLFLFFETANGRGAHAAAFTGLACLILWVGFGVWRLSAVTVEMQPDIRLRLVQANIDQRLKWHPALLDRHFNDHLSLTRSNSVNGRAENVTLVVWPETAVSEPLDVKNSLLRYRISKTLEEDAYLLTGAPRVEYGVEGRVYFNSLYAVDARANISAVYDKSHLVPFGEYLPFQPLMDTLGITQLVGGAGFSQGSGPKTLSLRGVPSFSTLICYEIIFPDGVVDKQNRPEWLLNITNDGWFGLSNGPYQHLALSRVRAVEEGLPLVRSTGSGISVVIDPLGRDVARLGLGARGVINAPLPKPVHDLWTLSHNKKYFMLFLILFLGVLTIYNRETYKLFKS